MGVLIRVPAQKQGTDELEPSLPIPPKINTSPLTVALSSSSK